MQTGALPCGRQHRTGLRRVSPLTATGASLATGGLKKTKGFPAIPTKPSKWRQANILRCSTMTIFLMPQAFMRIMERRSTRTGDYRCIYSDEDKLTEDGERRFDPFFKRFFTGYVLAFNSPRILWSSKIARTRLVTSAKRNLTEHRITTFLRPD